MFTFIWNYRNCTGVKSFTSLADMVNCITEMMDACPTISIERI